MSYKLTAFRGVALPAYGGESDISTGPAEDRLLRVPGGVFDAGGDDQAVQLPHNLSKRFRLMIDDMAAPTAMADLTDLYHKLRAQLGRRGYLVRQWPDGTSQRILARLMRLDGVRSPTHAFPEVAADFQIIDPYWSGEFVGTWTLDAGYYLDTGLFFDAAPLIYTIDVAQKTIWADHDGTAPVDSLILKITAQTSSITQIRISQGIFASLPFVAELKFTGTIAVGTSLVIDCGAQTVLNNGADAYADLSVEAGHSLDGWLRATANEDLLPPGVHSTPIHLDQRTGGGTNSTAELIYSHKWV